MAHDIDLDRDATLFVRLSEEEYRSASFLDNRVLRDGVAGAWIRQTHVSQVMEARPLTGLHPHYIFHTGHVGSTLLSRLLDAIPGVLGVREPLILRSLARASDRADLDDNSHEKARIRSRLAQQTALWRRSFCKDGVSIVKPTSSVARLGSVLLSALTGSRAVCLNVSLEVYVATHLAGENAPQDLSGHYQERAHRLAKLTGLDSPAASTTGEQAAAAWISESLTQRALSRQFGSRILFVDFDQLLASLPGSLRNIANHFGLKPPDWYFDQIELNPILFRYSKAPDAEFSPARRSVQLHSARATYGSEFANALAWAHALARRSPEVSSLFED
ncbi:MAG: hypothetical protein AB7P35_12480 [Hyphomonadaceae bacterium]